MMTPRPKPAEGPSPLFHLLTAGRIVRKGSSDRRAVMELQRFLNEYSLAHGGKGGLDVDGDFGARTRSILREFQAANGLDADGEVGMKTKAVIAQLRQAAAQPKPQAPRMVQTESVPNMGGAGQPKMPMTLSMPGGMTAPPALPPGALPRSVPTTLSGPPQFRQQMQGKPLLSPDELAAALPRGRPGV